MSSPEHVLPQVEYTFVHPDVVAVSANRSFGNMDPRFSDIGEVLVNRTNLAKVLRSRRTVSMVPYSTDEVVDLEPNIIDIPADGYRSWPESLRVPQQYDTRNPAYMADVPGDGLITRRPKVGLALNAADCAPLVLYAPDTRSLALLHVGRPGAEKDIAPKTVEHLHRFHKSDPEQLVAYFGPHIQPRSYKLADRMGQLEDKSWDEYLEPTEDGLYCDFTGYAAARLVASGVHAANISTSLTDVGATNQHFSLTRHKLLGEPNGRNGFMVMRRKMADDVTRPEE